MRSTRWVLACMALLVFSGAAMAAAEYVGASTCKLCHKTQYTSWETLDHAKAFDVLKPEEQANSECLKCHATGGKADLPGVQCEACHGPGSDYKSISVMKDQDSAVGAGLLIPDEATCRGCHENAPHEVPEFDYATAVEKGVHAHKAK